MRFAPCFFVLVLGGAVLGGTGCGDDDGAPEDGNTFRPGDLSAFAGYCKGVLTNEQNLMRPVGPGAWLGTGALTAPAGTTFLVEYDFGDFGGYVISDDQTPAKIADGSAGLTIGTDFTSDCATNPAAALTDFVVLQDATLYPNEDLTGTACVVPAGTSFDQHAYSSMGDVATFSSDELTARCGFSEGYSDDIMFGDLLPL